MDTAALIAALLASRSRHRWHPAPNLAGLDDRMRRDIGLPPRQPTAFERTWF